MIRILGQRSYLNSRVPCIIQAHNLSCINDNYSSPDVPVNHKCLLPQDTPIQFQQKRGAVIVKRKHKLSYKHALRPKIHLHQTEKVYDLVENTDDRKDPPIKVIIMDHIEGIGVRGDVVEVANEKARHAILAGSAVYASPENLKKYAHLATEDDLSKPSSKYISLLRKYIERMVCVISMNLENSWVIEPWHVQLGLRKAGIIAPLETISLDFPEPIEGPNLDLENKEFVAYVKVNNRENLPIRCRIHHVSTDPRDKIPYVPFFWLYPAEPIFPEHRNILQKITEANKMTIYETEDDKEDEEDY